MDETTSAAVAREPSEPTPDEVLDHFDPCVPYTVSELTEVFDDTSRWTVQRRLDSLVERGDLNKKKHNDRRVSYWISVDE